MSHDDLATAARAKYNNMVDSDKYYKLDPKDAKILALKKKLTALEQSVSANSANGTSNGRSGGRSGGRYRGSQGEKIAGAEKWRTFNIGTTIQHKGTKVWWCPSHKHKYGLFDGLYVWHKPEDHDAWLRSSRTAYLRNIRLRLLLRRILWRNINKDHLTN